MIFVRSISNALLLVLTVGLYACSSAPTQPIAITNGRVYETKAQIKTQEETNTVKIQVAVNPGKAIRFEVSATLGVPVATAVVTPKQISVAVHTQNVFYIGPFHEKTLYPLFKQNISPHLLWKIIHEQNPSTAKLKCSLDPLQKPLSCVYVDGTTVTWTYDEPNRKRIDIKNNKFEMNWVFKDVLQLPDYQNETFVLKKPDDYKEIIIK